MNQPAQTVSDETVTWALRLFMGREVSGDQELALHKQQPSLEALRSAFARSAEFRTFLERVTPPRRHPYRAPLFLLGPPADASIPYQFSLPSFERPVSQLCTGNQFTDPVYAARCAELKVPVVPHRKYWEWAYILQAMHVAAVTMQGVRALAFGAGLEPLPSFLASRGVTVLATDAPSELDGMQGWQTTGQHSKNVLDLHIPAIVSETIFLDHVSFRPVDMNAIPPDLVGFDVCWSSCSLEHLGSIAHGLQFIENSLKTLRPGGVAIHTTEFNLDSDDATFESEHLSLFRKQDFERLAKRLTEAGHTVWPLNFHPGLETLDEYIDLPPFSLPHLKLQLNEITSTSIGIIVRKAA